MEASLIVREQAEVFCSVSCDLINYKLSSLPRAAERDLKRDAVECGGVIGAGMRWSDRCRDAYP